uniref:MICOS complex subunit MIC60 n=1 Tax=Meloidogyne hapla TaxID=6305 RepID=A0A1I8C0B5_MELHA
MSPQKSTLLDTKSTELATRKISTNKIIIKSAFLDTKSAKLILKKISANKITTTKLPITEPITKPSPITTKPDKMMATSQGKRMKCVDGRLKHDTVGIANRNKDKIAEHSRKHEETEKKINEHSKKHEETNKKIDEHIEKHEETEKKITEHKEHLEKKEGQIEKLEKEIKEAMYEIKKSRSEMKKELEKDVDKIENQLKELGKKIGNVKDEAKNDRDQIKNKIKNLPKLQNKVDDLVENITIYAYCDYGINFADDVGRLIKKAITPAIIKLGATAIAAVPFAGPPIVPIYNYAMSIFVKYMENKCRKVMKAGKKWDFDLATDIDHILDKEDEEYINKFINEAMEEGIKFAQRRLSPNELLINNKWVPFVQRVITVLMKIKGLNVVDKAVKGIIASFLPAPLRFTVEAIPGQDEIKDELLKLFPKDVVEEAEKRVEFTKDFLFDSKKRNEIIKDVINEGIEELQKLG